MTRAVFSNMFQSTLDQAAHCVPAELVSLTSLLYHNIDYEFLSRETPIENGMLIVSIDIDVGSEKVGLANRGKNDVNVDRKLSESKIGQIEENVFPVVLAFFNDLEIPVTIALRGQLVEVGTSIADLILDSPVEHDVGSHGYYHKRFTEMSDEEAEVELSLMSKAMKAFNIKPRTFIFPRNKVAHLELIKKFGYVCYRDCGGFFRDGMYIKRIDGLYDVHPSLFVNRHSSPLLMRRLVEISVEKRSPFHMWFHCIDFGKTREEIKKNLSRALFPVLEHAKKKASDHTFSFETMLSATECFNVQFC